MKVNARLELEAELAQARRRALRRYIFCGMLLAIAVLAIGLRSFRTGTEPRITTPSATQTQSKSDRVAPKLDTDTPERVQPVRTRSAENEHSSTTSQNRSPIPNFPSRDMGSRAALDARQRVAVAYSQSASDVIQDLGNGFEETYGYQVQRRAFTEEDQLCSQWSVPDVVVVTGRMSDGARTRCRQFGARFLEFPIAYEAYVAVVHRENTWADSLTIDDLRTFGDRSPYDPLTTWSQLRRHWPSLPITIFGLSSTHRTMGDKFVPSRSARGLPITIKKDDAEMVRTIEATYGGLGFMTFATYEEKSLTAAKQYNPLPVRLVPIADAKAVPITPSRQTIEDGRYDALSRLLLIYVEQSALYRIEVSLFATHSIEAYPQELRKRGYTPIDKLSVDGAIRKIRSINPVVR